jgi:hypothetical protein
MTSKRSSQPAVKFPAGNTHPVRRAARRFALPATTWPELATGESQRRGLARPPNAEPSSQQRRAVPQAATPQLPRPRSQPSFVLLSLARSRLSTCMLVISSSRTHPPQRRFPCICRTGRRRRSIIGQDDIRARALILITRWTGRLPGPRTGCRPHLPDGFQRRQRRGRVTASGKCLSD